MMRTPSLPALLFGGALVAAGSVALAHGGATGVVKERMDLMKAIGERMKTLTQIFKGEAPYDSVTVADSAGYIRDHGGEHITELFPEGSLDEPTEALPTIWQDWGRFEGLSEQLVTYAGALAEAADNPRPEGGMAAGQGMMSGQGMMGGQGMTGGQGMMGDQGMMMGDGAGPDPEMLAGMPPDAAFLHLAQTCNGCHSKFRVEKEDDH
jgi:cytochrome c556